MKNEYEILLYYQYVAIEDPEAFRDAHKKMCDSLELKGRIIIADEGINGTVSGTLENTKQYMEWMHGDTRFATMPFKIDPTDGHAFRKMSVKYRSELVNLSLEDYINPLKLIEKHLKPAEF